MSRKYLVNKSETQGFIVTLSNNSFVLGKGGFVEVETTDPALMSYLTNYPQELVLQNNKPESDDSTEIENQELVAFDGQASTQPDMAATAKALEDQMKAQKAQKQSDMQAMAQQMEADMVEKKEIVENLKFETARNMEVQQKAVEASVVAEEMRKTAEALETAQKIEEAKKVEIKKTVEIKKPEIKKTK